MLVFSHDSFKNSIYFLLVLTFLFVDGAVHKTQRNQLTDFILHYEPLNYPKEIILHNHNRVRRSLNPREELHLNFKAYNRVFNLRLKRNIEIFASNTDFGDTNFQPENVYSGFLHGDPDSRVRGFVYDNIFEGRIYCGDGNEYHIESSKAHAHLNHTEHHSVIYNVKDIRHPKEHICGGIRPSTQDHMNHEANRTVWKNPVNDYVKFTGNEEQNLPHTRHRRAAFDPNKKECRLFLRADHTFVSHATTAERAMHLMTQLVDLVNHIYERTDFDNNKVSQNYSIKIERISVMSPDSCIMNPSSTDCQFKDENIGVEKFLDIASLDNHEQYCLSYVFAHRDFNDGVLGLAWIGDQSGAGGICDRYQMISGKMKSLNTGIVTNLNYGKTVPAKVTEITLAHEIGHNFGSQHDDPNSASCSPGGSVGNYIMFPRATSGSDPNNYDFSTCSKSNIWPVIQAKSGICFKDRGDPICGNRIVEKGEECDCGYENEDSCKMDKCCVGASTSGGGCKYKSTEPNRCSPSNGFCCDPNKCLPRTDNRVCLNATECAGESRCTDASPTCPTPAKVSDDLKKKCNSNQAVCVSGECTGSLCLAETVSNQACQCSVEKEHCKVCCQQGNKTDTCKALGSQDLPPGAPCDNYNGYCDILSKCRRVDAEGPLSRLKKWLFSSKTFDTILDWMKQYWWACILIGLGLVLFMAGFIACCSVHTPSSNPNKPKPRQLTLPRTLSRQNRRNPSAPEYNSGHPAPGEAPPGYNTATRGNRPGYGPSMELR